MSNSSKDISEREDTYNEWVEALENDVEYQKEYTSYPTIAEFENLISMLKTALNAMKRDIEFHVLELSKSRIKVYVKDEQDDQINVNLSGEKFMVWSCIEGLLEHEENR